MINLDILQNFSKKNYYSDPFPFFLIENCYPDKIYNILDKDYRFIIEYLKSNNNFNELDNKRFQINSETILNNEVFKKTIWYDFIKYHTSDEFLNKIIEIFESDLIKYYPSLFKKITNKNRNQSFLNIRGKDNNKSDFVIDCQPGINTPSLRTSKVRGPHVDNPVEIFGGLFYLRNKKDNSKGGDLEIFKTLNKKIYFEGKAEVKNTQNLKKVKQFEYQKNKCCFFLDSEKSIHGVSERGISEYPRNLINFVIETYKYEKLFKLKRNNYFEKFLKIFK